MGLFDKMFGRGASTDNDSQKRFDELKTKYQSVLNAADQSERLCRSMDASSSVLGVKSAESWDSVRMFALSLGFEAFLGSYADNFAL